MTELPACIHRGEEVDADVFACGTDRLVHAGVVPGHFCRNRCHVANKPRRQSQGLGDTVHKVTHALGIDKLMPGCGGCGKRMQKLNEAVPYDSADQ